MRLYSRYYDAVWSMELSWELGFVITVIGYIDIGVHQHTRTSDQTRAFVKQRIMRGVTIIRGTRDACALPRVYMLIFQRVGLPSYVRWIPTRRSSCSVCLAWERPIYICAYMEFWMCGTIYIKILSQAFTSAFRSSYFAYLHVSNYNGKTRNGTRSSHERHQELWIFFYFEYVSARKSVSYDKLNFIKYNLLVMIALG